MWVGKVKLCFCHRHFWLIPCTKTFWFWNPLSKFLLLQSKRFSIFAKNFQDPSIHLLHPSRSSLRHSKESEFLKETYFSDFSRVMNHFLIPMTLVITSIPGIVTLRCFACNRLKNSIEVSYSVPFQAIRKWTVWPRFNLKFFKRVLEVSFLDLLLSN